MQTYLLATTTLTLAALLLGLNHLMASAWRLWPLFLLAISQLLALLAIISSAAPATSTAWLQSLAVFSTFCIIWLLSPEPSNMSPWWRRGTKLSFLMGLGLAVLPLTSITWGAPPTYSLVIAIGGSVLLWHERDFSYWPHGATFAALICTSLLQLSALPSPAWLVNLLAYAFLIRALQQDILAAQPIAEPIEVIHFPEIPTENLQLLEISQTLNNLPENEQLIDEIVRHITQVTHVDQSALFILDNSHLEAGSRVMVYPPAQLWSRGRQQQLKLKLTDYPSLQESITTQQQLILPQANKNGLHDLYNLWEESSTGPTLLQPLTLHGQPVGALMLGNPLTNRPIHISDALLCQTLAPQIATLIRHHQLHGQAKVSLTKSSKSPQPDYLPVLNLLSEGVIISNHLGRVALVNKMAEQILGKSQAELLGQPIGTVYGQIASGETIEHLAATLSRQNKPIPTHLEANGRIIQGQLAPWRDEEGEWLGMITTFRDITLDLKEKNDQDDFMSILLRELRPPLTVIKGYSDLITTGVVAGYQPEQLELQAAIQSSVDRMVNILNNIAHFRAHLEQHLAFELLDVTEVIENAIQNIKPLTDLRQIELIPDIQPGLPPIMIDPRHLRRILDNLLDNACQFTPNEGQITVRAWYHAERFGTIIRPELFIAIEDTGIGIAAEEQRRIFKLFYQIKGPTETRGMGMGLAVVKTLLELQHGRIEVDSTLGSGSKFTLSFPLVE